MEAVGAPVADADGFSSFLAKPGRDSAAGGQVLKVRQPSADSGGPFYTAYITFLCF